MTLTGRQVRQLRSLAHHLEPQVTVGKGDIDERVAKQADEYLERHELMKGKVLEASTLTTREAAEELAQDLGADVVQVIGRRFCLYRPTSRDDVERIKLVE